jgi:nitrate/TMAO reductase-like tetraheme cytochrome c subunit
LVVGLAAGILRCAGGVAAEQEVNLIQGHLVSADATNRECLSCHQVVLTAKALDGKTKTPHEVHMTSMLLQFMCVDCHKSTDLREGSGAAVRRQVSPQFCARCHSPFSKKMTADMREQPACVECHEDWKKNKTKKGAREVAIENVGNKDCIICHGGKSWYKGK